MNDHSLISDGILSDVRFNYMPKLNATKPRADTATFTFRLTPREAQNIFNLCECMKEERSAFRQIWSDKEDRRRVVSATRKFSKQLCRQYSETGIEV